MHNTGKIALAFGISMLSGYSTAVEITVKNDSLVNLGTAVIVTGFVPGEKAAAWLTTPCTGNVRAVQIFWRSQAGTAASSIEQSIEILRAGTFPVPGALHTTVLGPVLNDGVLNEYRFVDENNTIPISVPVTAGETFVVAFEFGNAPPDGVGPSVARDTDGIGAGRNGLLAVFGASTQWFNASTLGVTGDWIIRAVVDCPVVASNVDVSVSQSALPSAYTAGSALSYQIQISNAGPAASNSTSVVDIFPASFTGVSWSCNATGGASCPGAGTGNITTQVNLPAGGAVTFTAGGTISLGTTGVVGNTATVVVPGSVTDTNPNNNSNTLNISADTGLLFSNGFENTPIR